MAFNPGFFGDQRQVSGRIAAKYSHQAEAEVNEWIKALIGHQMQTGMQAVEKELKTGIILVKICQKLAEGTPTLPDACRDIKLVPKESGAPFQQMENIDLFLNFSESYGVPKTSLFQTVDLYEGRNMASVLTCLLCLGSEAQRHGFRGPVCGPKPNESRRVGFTLEQLKNSETMIPTQSGTNKYASQQGMQSFGAVRHGGDTQYDSTRESNGFVTLQMGTNKFANQSGMFIGGFRPLYDRHLPDGDKQGEGLLTLQTGTNKFASQKGMAMGSFRDVNYKGDLQAGGSEAFIPLQSGTNKFANQAGMHMGCRRDILVAPGVDIGKDVTLESQSILSPQYGSNKFASQQGMTSLGGFRDIVGGKAGDALHDISQASQAIIPTISGTNKFASQKGMAMGAFRDVADAKSSNQHAQASEGIITLQAGYNHGATQKGMVFGGTRHGADLKITPIWSDF